MSPQTKGDCIPVGLTVLHERTVKRRDSGVQDITRPPCIGMHPALPFLMSVLLTLGASCQKQTDVAKVPASPLPRVPAVAEAAPAPAEPVSEPQTQDQLAPSQEIPAGAMPQQGAPLALADDPRRQDPGLSTEVGEVTETTAADGAAASSGDSPARAFPQLGKILTADQRRAYDRAIERSIQSVRQTLAGIVDRSLTPDQINAVRRIRGFLSQAEAARKHDPAIAKNLADRARLLAQDLAQFLR